MGTWVRRAWAIHIPKQLVIHREIYELGSWPHTVQIRSIPDLNAKEKIRKKIKRQLGEYFCHVGIRKILLNENFKVQTISDNVVTYDYIEINSFGKTS